MTTEAQSHAAMATCQALNMKANSLWSSHCLLGEPLLLQPMFHSVIRESSEIKERVSAKWTSTQKLSGCSCSMQDSSPSFKGPWHGTWAQPAVLWETFQPMFQQHRDDAIQVRHLTRKGLERREQNDKVFCFLPWCWVKR